jgi:hypothetical protein
MAHKSRRQLPLMLTKKSKIEHSQPQSPGDNQLIVVRRVLKDMARAQRMGVSTDVIQMDDSDTVKIDFRVGDDVKSSVIIGPEIQTEWWAYGVESMLDSLQDQIDQHNRRNKLRKQALLKLTDEERDVLGV